MKEGLSADNIRGLSEEEALRRLREDGYNEIPSAKRRSIYSIAYDVVTEPMFLLLIAGGILYLFLGDLEEALLLLFFVVVVMGITLYQESKTERALEALRDLSSPRAIVIRDGRQRRIPGREVVVGDYVVVTEGDRVPADAVVLAASNLLVDESLLTGESVSVRKSAGDASQALDRPGGDDLPFVYSGTMAVQGHGITLVKGIGVGTEIGRIGKALRTIEDESDFFEAETGKLVRYMAAGGLVLCVLVVVLYGLSRGSWVDGFLAGIALAMAMLPEEIPVVFTIFLAIGAWRMSKRNVLTRRLQAIRTLGATTVLCVDKTGTITLNRMSLNRLYTDGRFHPVESESPPTPPEEFHELLEYSILASQKYPFDPMEKSIKELGLNALSGTEHIHNNWSLVREYTLSKDLLALSHVWKSPDGSEFIIAAKGAPEAIVDLCHLDTGKTREISDAVSRMASDGLRVLGVARASFSHDTFPVGQHDFNFIFVGLIGFADPIRPGIADAVRECYDAGIRVVMITGDYAGTAQMVAKEIGLRSPDAVVTGWELASMGEEELRRKVREVNVFARVVPEQKLVLVKALKANGEIVAMTGDGVNDAPALKAAHIGVAMGLRGTDVARESGSLVITDDNFTSIVSGVRMGRRILDNLKKALAYILSVHVPIAGMSFLPVLMRWPLALMPAHIAFLELIIDPACSVVFEAEEAEKDVMKRPPRRLTDPLFSRKDVVLSLLQGLMVLLVVANVYVLALYRGIADDEARTMAFTALVIANLGLILTNRSWNQSSITMLRTQNKALIWVFGGTLFFLGLVLYLPFLQGVFHFQRLSTSELAMCVSAGVVSVLWFEAVKVLNSRWHTLL